MRIKEAIDRYNDNRKEGAPKINTRVLVKSAMPSMVLETGEQIIWHWSKGKKYNKLTRDIVANICKTLKVDANYLFEGVNISAHPELEISGMVGVMGVTGMTPNKILSIRAMRSK